MTNYVIVSDGQDYGEQDGRLAPIVQGETGKTLVIDVRDPAGNDFDISGATGITARMTIGSTTTTATGTITEGAGVLSWELSLADAGTAGSFSLIFQFTLGGDTYKTYPIDWNIIADPGAAAVQDDFLTYLAEMDTAPSGTWQSAGNQLFADIKDALGIDNLSDAFDVFYVLAAETQQAGLLNAVNPGVHDASNVNSMIFTASRGFTGNGSSSYLNTNYNASSAGIRYVLNSASFGVYSRTDLNTSQSIGANDGGTIVCLIDMRFSNVFLGGINGNPQLVNASANSLGLFAVNRSGISAAQFYKNGQSAATSSGASTSVPNENIYIGAYNNNGAATSFSTRQLALAFAGRSMTAAEHLAFYTAVQTFLTAIGAQV